MTIEIKPGANGDVIWGELAGRAVPLPVENLYVRALDGHCFLTSQVLDRLRPHEPALVQFWLDQNPDGITPVIFAGEPPKD